MDPVAARSFFRVWRHVDWLLIGSALLITIAGLLTMNSFTGENPFFERQLIWFALALAVFFALAPIDFRFLRRTSVIVTFFLLSIASLVLVLLVGDVVKGAQSRFDFGAFAFQPSDPAKLILILLLAKYFSRRHIEIAHVRHILISGIYAFIIAFLLFLQPDLGSAIIVGVLWLGMILVSGVSRKHLLALLILGAVSAAALWTFALADYQKQRVLTFLNPVADLRGAGYNAYQSTIAVGSGELLGKGVGYGTQSKLQFLPEYETDFIFAAFAEEWGFIGVLILFSLYGVFIWRVLRIAQHGASNFEILYGAGVSILFISHFLLHVGINIGILPVTGTTIPFMSYGGSHLITEFIALGILMGQRAYSPKLHKEDLEKEFVGV